MNQEELLKWKKREEELLDKATCKILTDGFKTTYTNQENISIQVGDDKELKERLANYINSL